MQTDGHASGNGARFADHVADAAANWLTELMSGDASDADVAQWQQWRAADPEHERAWQHIEAMSGQIFALDAKAALQALNPPPRTRRRMLKAFAALAVAGTSGYAALQSPVGRRAVADVRTATGEQQRLAFGNDTNVLINTDSALNMRRVGSQALLELLGGEVIIDAAAAALGPPVVVAAAFARLQVQVGRVHLREFADHTLVTVLAGETRVAGPSDARMHRLAAGYSQRFRRQGTEPARPAQADAAAWADGQLIAEDMPLGQFLLELARYRPGVIRCDPAIAARTVSGVFPLQDTDAVLRAVAAAAGARLRQRTRYWVVVEAN